MRLLIVLHQFYPEFSGGTERVALNLARGAQRAGHHVRVLACAVNRGESFGVACAGLPAARDTVYQGVPVTLLPRTLLPAAADYSLDIAPELVDPLAQWMRSERFDLVHVMHTMRMGTAVLAAQRCGLPYLLTLTDFFLPCARINLVDLDNRLCDGPRAGEQCAIRCRAAPWDRESLLSRHAFARNLLASASLLVAPSEFVAERYRTAFPGCSVRVVPHGIDLLALGAGDDDPPRLAGEGPLVLGYVGAIHAQKGLDVLLRAFAKVQAPQLRLRVIGGFYGPRAYHDDIRALASADLRVELLGQLGAGDVLRAVRGLDLLCLPSRVPETFSLALHEAAALGVPALVSNLGAPGDLLSRTGGGQAVAAGDVRAWADAIRAIAHNPAQLGLWRAELQLPLRVEEESFFYDAMYRTLLPSA